jgi:hypothetical protein
MFFLECNSKFALIVITLKQIARYLIFIIYPNNRSLYGW